MRRLGGRSANQGEKEGEEYRVDRVLGFFSSRPYWDPHTHSPKGGAFGSGGDTLACGRGGGGPNADDWSGQTLWCTRCKCTLWGGGKTGDGRSLKETGMKRRKKGGN
jgi:hypothetical protein